MDTREIIKEMTESILDEAIRFRRHFHSHPELSFHEHQTAQFIRSVLKEYDIDFIDGIAENGLIARIDGKQKGAVVALRADMDALPVDEQSNHSFQSKNKGIMHACWHDLHMSILLGSLILLQRYKDQLKGTILGIFQPAEEKIPGGAKMMMSDPKWPKIKPDLILSQHVMPQMNSGTIGVKPGIYMASVDELYLTIKGKGGHAAMPHQVQDTILAGCQLISNLQEIVSRHNDPAIPSVLTFGRFEALGSTNIIPGEVKIQGTFRTMDHEWREKAHTIMTSIIENHMRARKIKAEFKINKGYPYLTNHPGFTSQLKEIATLQIGSENIKNLDIEMTAEDFAYFSQEYPAVMYRLGIKPPHEEEIPSLHSAFFTADESAIKTGIEVMSRLAIEFVHNLSK